jgi:(E)-4-hydroxy-3-methylbut-2-enyl-diphosphate synthase
MSAITSDPPAPTGTLPYIENPYHPFRRRTREVRIGTVGVGGANPIRVQSMTTTRTQDIEATTAQVLSLVEAGCEIVRITAPTVADTKAIGAVRQRVRAMGIAVPFVADIHFSPAAALAATEHVEKLRVNPGNFADSRKFAVRDYTDGEYQAELERVAMRFTPVVLACKERGVAMRIGTNHGSLSDRVMNRFGDSPEGMVESALEFVRICESHGYHDIVLSMKASNPKVMIAAYRLLVARMDAEGMAYPLHLGVTEAGNGDDARIKSATGIGSLLLDGLGDTIRVSLAEDPEAEIPVAQALVRLCAQPFAPAAAHTDDAVVAQPPSATVAPLLPSDRSRRSIFTADAQPDSSSAIPSSWPQPEATFVPAAPPPLPWDPFHYARRATWPVQLGGLQLGEGTTIAVAGQVPNRETVALPVLGAGRLKGHRPDALVLDLHTPDDLDRARHLAWKGEGVAGRGLIARGEQPDLLQAALPSVEGVCLVLQVDRIAAEGTQQIVEALAQGTASSGKALWLELDLGDAREEATGDPEATVSSADGTGAGETPALPGDRPDLRPRSHGSVWGDRDRRHRVEALVGLAQTCVAAGQRNLLLGLRTGHAATFVCGTRLLAALLAAVDLPLPLALEAPRGEEPMLQGAAALGSLLCDGVGDLVQAGTVLLAFDLLQGAGARLTRTDYVACPSCGRTLFDLQTTTDRIKASTAHLQGVKIAIMGCVVNGPGEMADADFGYMGGSPGHVNLYVGKDCVERNVPEEEADARLIALIRAHGRWMEPGAADE